MSRACAEMLHGPVFGAVCAKPRRSSIGWHGEGHEMTMRDACDTPDPREHAERARLRGFRWAVLGLKQAANSLVPVVEVGTGVRTIRTLSGDGSSGKILAVRAPSLPHWVSQVGSGPRTRFDRCEPESERQVANRLPRLQDRARLRRGVLGRSVRNRLRRESRRTLVCPAARGDHAHRFGRRTLGGRGTSLDRASCTLAKPLGQPAETL